MREKLNRLATQMQDMLAKAKSEGRKHFTSAEREKYHRMEQEYSELEEEGKIASGDPGLTGGLAALASGARISDVHLEEVRDQFRLSPAAKRAKLNAMEPHEKAFSAYLRLGERLGQQDRAALDVANAGYPEIRNAMSTTVGTQGGDLVPQGFSNLLEEAKKWFGGIEGTVDKITTGTGTTMPWPTINDTTNKGRIIGQNVQMVETDLVFSTISFSAYIGSSDLILVPLALIQDSYFDLDAMAARLLGTRLGRLYNNMCTVGTGANQPTGIVTAATTAGNIYTMPTGNTASITYAGLVNLQHSVDPSYRENPASKWMFSDAFLKLLKLLVDGNSRPLWQPGLIGSFQDGASVTLGGARPKILENEYVVNQDMAAPATSAYSALFGDLSTFKVREVAGGTTVLVLRERYADYLQVGMTAFQRFDSNLVDAGTHPIALLQQSSS
jgi:HK97 family phage major capsid protein